MSRSIVLSGERWNSKGDGNFQNGLAQSWHSHKIYNSVHAALMVHHITLSTDHANAI
jgi:hypothetical protein